MEFSAPGFCDDIFECSADFVVHDLDVDFVVVFGEVLHDGVVGSDAAFAAFALEWGAKDDIAVTVVDDHVVLVATVCTNVEAAGVICANFADWVNANVEFV